MTGIDVGRDGGGGACVGAEHGEVRAVGMRKVFSGADPTK